MKKEQKKKSIAVVVIVVILAAVAIAAYFLFFNGKGTNKDADNKAKTVEKQPATEFSVTPCDEEDIALFTKTLEGVWTSYTEEGVAFTYTFNKDGSIRYKKDGADAEDYSYTFKDGLLTVKGGKRPHVYQLSKDAVGMMARMHNGEYQNYFAIYAEKVPNFGGCVYITDDILYLGDICLCKDSSMSRFDGKSIEGDWIGAVGDTVNFASDGSYTYIKNADTYKGTYQADLAKKTLDITISGKTNHHDKDTWGISGRTLHIGKQYYFKLS